MQGPAIKFSRRLTAWFSGKMLTKKQWDLIKKKLAELSPHQRVRELKVIAAQLVDSKMIKECKELLEKAILEVELLGRAQRFGGELSISSRFQMMEDDAPKGDLDEAVAQIPVMRDKEEDPEVKYEASGDDKGYSSESYFSDTYETSGADRVKETLEDQETLEHIKEKLDPNANKDYTRGD